MFSVQLIIIFIFFIVNIDENYSIKIDEILAKLESICTRENSKDTQFNIKSKIGLQYGKKRYFVYDDYDL